MTGYLRVVNQRLRPYSAAAAPLAELLRSAKTTRVLDLCSGSGGPWPCLADDLEDQGLLVSVRCSDLYPNDDIARVVEQNERFEYLDRPVSALNVPEEFKGVRTLFTALHHFEPDQVRGIFEDAQHAGRHIAVFEVTHRSLLGIAATLLTPIMAFVFLPMVKPRRWLPLLLSYFPPLVPLAIGWDGTVSTLRSYRAEELEALVAPLRTPHYHWRVQELDNGTPLPMTCVIGWPTRQ